MKAILISIKPKYVAKILNGDKTIEIRKTMPKCDLPIDVYIYCTKDNHQLVKPKVYDKHLLFTKGAVDYSHEHTLNGKAVAKFILNKVEEIKAVGSTCANFKTKSLEENELLQLSCLGYHELFNYFQPSRDYEGYESKVGYAWHIDNLVIFDRPKELNEFKVKAIYEECSIKCPNFCEYGYNCTKGCEYLKPLTKTPQSWRYVEVIENE